MSATTLSIYGGQGGGDFSFTGLQNGATLQKIGVWVGESTVKAVRVWLTDGRVERFGDPSNCPYKEFEFEVGESFKSLSLWGNGAGTRLGAIKLVTSRGREFFVKMTKWGLKTEYPIDIGSGICLGVVGKCGLDIDRMGFLFINQIESAVVENVKYPTIGLVQPQLSNVDLASEFFDNLSGPTELHAKFECSKKLITKASWSVTNKIEASINVKVKASFLKIVEVSTGFGFSLENETKQERETTDEIERKWSFDVCVPPYTKLMATSFIGRAIIDLPYTGTMRITCKNGSVLQYNFNGTFNGATYSTADVKVTTVSAAGPAPRPVPDPAPMPHPDGKIVSIESANFSGIFLRMDGSGLSPSNKPSNGGRLVNCQHGAQEWERFILRELEGDVIALESSHFSGVYLRMDGSSVKSNNQSGGGVVNAQFGIGAWEKFRLRQSNGGNVSIESVQFPGVFLRMDGRGVPQGSNGGGLVNCQWGAGGWEQFKLHFS